MFISDQFEVLEQVGRGGFGSVFKARHLLSDRIVAVKLLDLSIASSEAHLLRFQREAKTTSALAHPHIVKVFSFGLADDGRPFFAMEFLNGRTLAQRLLDGPLNPEEFNQVFSQVCSALSYAHGLGVIHRDLKPDNIMLLDENSEPFIKLLDFGIASRPEIGTKNSATLTSPDKLIGTPAYMSPEQCSGQRPDARSDIYSLACIMYEALTCERLVSGQTAHEMLLKHLDPTPLQLEKRSSISLSQALNNVLSRCLSKNPDQRFQSAEELNSQISRAINSGPLVRENSSKTRVLSIGAISLLSVLLVLILTFVITKRASSPDKIAAPVAPLPGLIELERKFMEAETLNDEGRNGAAIEAYKIIISYLDQYQAKTGRSKVANLKYKCYKGIIQARLHTEDEVGPVAIEDWRNCMDAAIQAYSRGSKEEHEAQLRLAFVLTIDGPKKENIPEIMKLCKRAEKTVEAQFFSDSAIPMIELKSSSNTRIRFSDCKAIIGHIRDLAGQHEPAVTLLNEAVLLRGDKNNDERAFYQRVWLCEALHNSLRKAEESKAINEFFQALSPVSKIPPTAKNRITGALFDFYLSSADPKKCLFAVDKEIKSLSGQSPVSNLQLANAYYYRAAALLRLKQINTGRTYIEKAKLELAKCEPQLTSNLEKKLSDLQKTLRI